MGRQTSRDTVRPDDRNQHWGLACMRRHAWLASEGLFPSRSPVLKSYSSLCYDSDFN